ncbi:MAG: hypothetical protein M1822_008169 [Bathelium mastoideum]|nr:MAG: hypothetical protein M1822_008169 [Bathelium mastoideum]
MDASAVREQINRLTNEADKHLRADELVLAAQCLREAGSIDPGDPRVKDLWASLQEREREDPLLRLCQTYVATDSLDVRKQIFDFLNHQTVQPQVVGRCFDVLLESRQPVSATDALIGSLIKAPGAQKYFANEFRERPTASFNLIWRCGEDAIDATTTLILDSKIWDPGNDCRSARRNVFQLLLAKIMGGDSDDLERAMKNIARLLARAPTDVAELVDSESFDSILSCLDIRLSPEIRGQTTLAVAKTLEAMPEHGQAWLAKYVTVRVAKRRADDLLVAFSAAAAVFPVVPSVASMLFLSPGFLESLIPMLKKNKSASKMQLAALEMFSAACIDKQCRVAIHQHCTDWLREVVEQGTEETASSVAALVLVKTEGAKAPAQGAKGPQIEVTAPAEEPDDLVKLIKNMVLNAGESYSQQIAVEAIAYASLQSKTKEDLGNDEVFLAKLVELLSAAPTGNPTLFGGLTIVANLTAYRPAQSAEQKRISELKAYANTSKPEEAHPAEQTEQVTARCKKILNAGIVPVLVARGSKASPGLFSLISQVLLSLAFDQKHRGTLAQQGAVKTLIQAYNSLEISGTIPPPAAQPADTTSTPARIAAHALARILISVNPSHVFPSSAALPMTSAIRPLISLLTDDQAAEQRDLLPTFESLMALTNLASADQEVSETIVRLSWPSVETLLLSSNPMVQCAAVELVCNLTTCPSGIALFADGSKSAKNRMHILLALADVEKLETRRAAGGALAMLTDWEGTVDAILDKQRGTEILLCLCAEQADDLKHRGFACVKNIVCRDDSIGKQARERVRREGGVDRLKRIMTQTRNPAVLELGVEALKRLQ